MTSEEFLDFYTEGSFAIRDAEVQFKLQIGEALLNEPDIEQYAKVIKKHKSFLIECIEVYKKWNEIEKEYTKEKSWSDLVKLVGIEREKRPRKSLKPLKKVIEERKQSYEAYLKTHAVTVQGDIQTSTLIEGRLKEDIDLLNEEVKE